MNLNFANYFLFIDHKYEFFYASINSLLISTEFI